MLKSAKDHFGDDTLWTFQEDGAASHTAMLHRTGAESIFLGFGLKKCASLLPRSESYGFFGVVHPRSQGLWKNSTQC